jgi:integrase/transposase InsO family protein
MKFYYENVLVNQNKTAKTNIAWVADITEIELNRNKKLYVFLCLDIHSNTIIAQTFSQRVITSQATVNCLKKAIKKRFVIIPKMKTILHTDRGTQFSSQCYNSFINQFEQFIIPSMSRENTPTDNGVAERFMRTFKGHQIDGKIIEQAIQETILLDTISESKSYRTIVNSYVESINKKPNRKSFLKGPERYDMDVSSASTFMREPLYPKAFSEHFGVDLRREEIYKYKSENLKIVSLLEEFATQKSEIVDKTPFDKFDGSLALELIDRRLKELYRLIQDNELTIRKSVGEAIEPVNENIAEFQEQFLDEMDGLNKKVDMLLPKVKKDRQVELLRDPIDINLFPIFLVNAGNSSQRRQDLRKAQLRITYTILYYCGLRINEIRHLNKKDLETAIAAAQFNLVHHKTKQAHIHVLSKKAVQDLQALKLEYLIVFEKYQYKYLFGKHKPITDKNLIKMVNKDLLDTCKKFNIPFNVKSHSFRINMITNLLKVTSVQNTADIIGHSDIRSTMIYNRYALSKAEIQDLLDQIEN